MKTLFEKMIGIKVPCDYRWDDDGIVRIGAKRDIAAYVAGGFGGKCVIFLHGNGETATTEKFLYDSLNEKGISVIAPDYRGYGLTCGEFSERGCFEVAHAAYVLAARHRTGGARIDRLSRTAWPASQEAL